MKRIETTNRAVDLFGPGKDGFRAALPGVSVPTYLSAKFCNDVQESIVRVLERAGITPGDDYDQLAEAIDGIVSEAQVSDYAALRAYAGARKSIYVTGYLATATPSGIAGLFVRDDSDTTSADNGGTVVVAANGSRWRRAHSGFIDPQWFGAPGTGTSDETAFMQAAIDEWSKTPSLEIKLSARHRIDGTLLVKNLETDDPEVRLNFAGGGTLIKNNAGFMFDKPAGQALQTGHLFFIGIRFEGANLNGLTFILNGDNIIRTHFVGCFGTKINVAKAAAGGYLQTITQDKATTWRKWSGYLFDCGYCFDLDLAGVYEAGDGVLVTRKADADPACNGLRVSGNIEGLSGASGRAVQVGVCWATVISVRYCEKNNGGDFDFNQGIGFHKGLTIMGCGFQPTDAQLADAGYYPVITGKGAQDSISLIGNASTHNLFDVTTGNQSAIVDSGNYVAAGKKKFSPTSSRLFKHEGPSFIASLLPGYGVSLNGYDGSLGFEATRGDVNGEQVAQEVMQGGTNPQVSPGDYGNRNWQKGTLVINTTPTVALRQYGAGVTHDALILGWSCMASGAPGVWKEIAVMTPY